MKRHWSAQGNAPWRDLPSASSVRVSNEIPSCTTGDKSSAAVIGLDFMKKLSLEVLSHVFSYLPVLDVLKLESLSKKFQAAVSVHLRIRKVIDFSRGHLYCSLPGKLTDTTLLQLFRRCKDLRFIYGFHPVNIVKRRSRRTRHLSIRGVVDALSQLWDLRGIELSNVFLLEAIMTYLPKVEILGMFKNRNRRIPPSGMTRITLPSNPRITSLNLTGVVVSELPPMEYVKHIHLSWVKLNQHPFKEFSAPNLKTFVMANCAGPTNALKYVPLMTALALARSLSRLVLIRVPFLGGLIQHLVEEYWRIGGFRWLQFITMGTCKHALEVDLGVLVISCAFRLEELCIQPSLTKDSFFSCLNVADIDFPFFDSLTLGYADPLSESGKWTNKELVSFGLADITESPAMITDIGMRVAGKVFRLVKRMEIYNCPHLHNPTTWITNVGQHWRALRELTLRRCHAIRLADFCSFIPMLPVLESLHLESMFKEPPKGCSRVGLSAGTGLGVSSALVSNTGTEAGNNDDLDDEEDLAHEEPVNNNNNGEPANQEAAGNNPLPVGPNAEELTSKPGSSHEDSTGNVKAENSQANNNKLNSLKNSKNDDEVPSSSDNSMPEISEKVAAKNVQNNAKAYPSCETKKILTEDRNEIEHNSDTNEASRIMHDEENQVTKNIIIKNQNGSLKNGSIQNTKAQFESSALTKSRITSKDVSGESSSVNAKRVCSANFDVNETPGNKLEINSSVDKKDKQLHNSFLGSGRPKNSASPRKVSTSNCGTSTDSPSKSTRENQVESSCAASKSKDARNNDKRNERKRKYATMDLKQVPDKTLKCYVKSQIDKKKQKDVQNSELKSSAIATDPDCACIVCKAGTFHGREASVTTQQRNKEDGNHPLNRDAGSVAFNPDSQLRERSSCFDNVDGLNKPLRVALPCPAPAIPGKSLIGCSPGRSIWDEADCRSEDKRENPRGTAVANINTDNSDVNDLVESQNVSTTLIDGDSSVKDECRKIIDGKFTSNSLSCANAISLNDNKTVDQGQSSQGGRHVLEAHDQGHDQSSEVNDQDKPIKYENDANPSCSNSDSIIKRLVKALPRPYLPNLSIESQAEVSESKRPRVEYDRLNATTTTSSHCSVSMPKIEDETESDLKVLQSQGCSRSSHSRTSVKGSSKVNGKGKGKRKKSPGPPFKDLETKFEIAQQKDKPGGHCLIESSEVLFRGDDALPSTSYKEKSFSVEAEVVNKGSVDVQNCIMEDINTDASWANPEPLTKNDDRIDDVNNPTARKEDKKTLTIKDFDELLRFKEDSPEHLNTTNDECTVVKPLMDHSSPPIPDAWFDDDEFEEEVLTVTVSGDSSSSFISTPSKFEAQGNKSINSADFLIETRTKSSKLDLKSVELDSRENICINCQSTLNSDDASTSEPKRLCQNCRLSVCWPKPNKIGNTTKSASDSEIDKKSSHAFAKNFDISDGQRKSSKGKNLKGRSKSYVKHSGGKVSQACQAISDEIRETTKKAKDNEVVGKIVKPRSTRVIQKTLCSTSVSLESKETNKTSLTADVSSSTDKVLGAAKKMSATLRKPNTNDQSTSTSDPVIEDDHFQVLTLRSRSLVNLTLHKVGVTDIILQDCPFLSSIQATSCRVLKKVTIQKAHYLQRATFAQCKKLDERHLLEEICKLPVCVSRNVFLRPMKEIDTREIERLMFKTSPFHSHMCLIRDFSLNPEETVYNHTRVIEWSDMFFRVNYDLTMCQCDFPVADNKRGKHGHEKYPWGRRIYTMQGKYADSTGSAWDLITDIPWLKPLSERPDVNLPSLAPADFLEGVHCPKAKGQSFPSRLMEHITLHKAELQEAGLGLFNHSVIVFINMCDTDGIPTPDLYL